MTQGTDLTIVTYGSCVNLALRAVERLATLGVSAELIDVQTLLPFDLGHSIVCLVEEDQPHAGGG